MNIFGSQQKTIYVAFAWADGPAVPVMIGSNQTVREVVGPYLPSSINSTNIGVIDVNGRDVTNVRGSDIEEDTRVIVNTTGFVPGGTK